MGKQYSDFQHRFSDPGEEEKTGGSLHECDLLKKSVVLLTVKMLMFFILKLSPYFNSGVNLWTH